MILGEISCFLSTSRFFFVFVGLPIEPQPEPEPPLLRWLLLWLYFSFRALVRWSCILSIALVAASGSPVAFRRFLGEPRVSDLSFLLEVVA